MSELLGRPGSDTVSEYSVADEIRAILKAPSERDLQKLVGPSDLSDPCAYCLGQKMIQAPEGAHKYWVGARIGTAIHRELEEVVPLHRPGWVPESRVVVGEIPGYGVIYGTCDLFVPERQRVVDYKTTTRNKMLLYQRAQEEPSPYDTEAVAKARSTLNRYLYQAMLYAKGKIAEGIPVKDIEIVFICRDGKTDTDIWSPEPFRYDEAAAQRVLDRAQRVWEHDKDDLPSDKHCFVCTMSGRV